MKLFDWLLTVYPRGFRERFGEEMHAAFTQDYARARARGRLAGLLFLTTTILRGLCFGFLERLPRAVTIRSFVSVDVRDAIRSLWATPLVSAVAILSLALGIGANTALFSILNSLVLRQLPVREPHKLVMVGRTDWTNPIWEQLRLRQSELFESACAWSFQRFNLSDTGRADPVDGVYVSGGLFDTLGINMVAGRPLTPADDVRGGGPDGHVAVISHRFWQQRFGGARDVLERQLTLNRVRFRIVGVAPRGFDGPEVGQAMDVFLPIASEAAIRGSESALDGRSSSWLQVLARLRPDQGLETAAAALNAARPAIRHATLPSEFNAEYRAGYLTGKDDFALVPAATGVSTLRARFQEPLTILMVVVAAVLLIASANIANLMLARATARRHDLSLRLALGASRTRLACQLFVESLLLAVVGGVAGLMLAEFGGSLLIRQLGSEGNAVSLDLSVDWRVLGFTAAVAVGATLLFGVAPVLGLRSVEASEALKEHNRTVAGDRRVRLRSALVVSQVAVSFALVAGAGVFVRTFATLLTTPLGFDPTRLLVVSVESDRSGAALETHVERARRVTDAAATAPGISRASLSYLTPMSGRGWTHRVGVSGGPELPREEQVTTVNAVAPGWFETYGMRLFAGRDFVASDRIGSEQVVIVNDAFVRRFVGPQNPLGQRVRGLGLGRLKESVIVGVVNDAIYRTARLGIVPTMYLPMAQADLFGSKFAVTVKLASGHPFVERGLTDALLREDPDLAFSFRHYGDQVRATIVQERIVAMLSGFFGVLALLLAALGLYGIAAYSVSRRRSEIALRMALGESTGGIVRRVLSSVGGLIACGAAVGMVVSLWAAQFVSALTFGVDARDPITLAGTASILAGVGLFAAWLPARTASRVDPALTLKG